MLCIGTLLAIIIFETKLLFQNSELSITSKIIGIDLVQQIHVLPS